MMRLTHNRVAASRLLALVAVLAALMAASLMLAEGPAQASTTFTVNSIEDHADQNLEIAACDTGYDLPGGGQVDECTLRAAIQQANYTAGADTINFAIPGSGLKTIAPVSALPIITEAVTINGYSQGSATADPADDARPNTLATGAINAAPKIELNGQDAGLGAHGLEIQGSNSVVRGLVINSFDSDGVHIEGPGNTVEGNFIGTDSSGTQDLGNGDSGVETYRVGANDNSVGGSSPGARNLISGNDDDGVVIDDGQGNRVLGNLVGTTKDGAAPLGNFDAGVRTSAVSNNTVGGGTPEGANTIASNGGNGVEIVSTGSGNRILSNSIFSNGGLGIDLGDDGSTANDPGDADTGPNGFQNKPVVRSAETGGTKTAVSARLNSAPNRTFVVRFFSNPSGTDEGKKFIGQKSVGTDGSGNATFSFSPAQKVALGRTITATATSPVGNTSEFSDARTVVSA